jgi:hypothetical protein
VALFLVMWRERESAREAAVAVVAGTVLAAWAILPAVLAARGFFLQPQARRLAIEVAFSTSVTAVMSMVERASVRVSRSLARSSAATDAP